VTGSVGPQLLYYKNFANETAGSLVANPPDFAVSGLTYTTNANGYPYVISGSGLPYGKAMILGADSRIGNESTGAGTGGISLTFPSQISEVFSTSTVYFPTACNYSGILTSAGNPQIKHDWLFCNKTGGGGFNDTDFWVAIDNQNIGLEFSLQSNAAPWGQLDFGTNVQWVWGSGPAMKQGVPIRSSRWVQINAPPGSGTGNLLWIGVWDGSSNSINTNNNGQIMVASGSAYNGYQIMTSPGFVQFGGSNPQFSVSNNCYAAEGEIYVAGPSSGNTGAAARIEIGDSSSYTSCTQLATCTVESPTWWSSGQIQFRVRKGVFYGSTVGKHLFVTNSSNVTSYAGQINV
jgi:hypothetical protein